MWGLFILFSSLNVTCLLLVTDVAVDVITSHIKGSAVTDFRGEILWTQIREAGIKDGSLTEEFACYFWSIFS